MKKSLTSLLAAALALLSAGAQEFNDIPSQWKWLDANTAAFSYDGSFADSSAFSVRTPSFVRGSVPPAAASLQPDSLQIEGAVNPCYSPDSSKVAFTRGGDLYVYTVGGGTEKRLTFDGDNKISNGYASWVYYEEILGRASHYKAFWWSPDSRRIGFYRFDNSGVPFFSIYSPKGQSGRLSVTAYPKAGQVNPQVRIGMVSVADGEIVWADFDESLDQYFGIPFWGADSNYFYVAREPRVQNTLDLYAVSALDGSKKQIYHEEYPTWINWMDEIKFGRDGLYMVRAFETGWEQIYYLSYDGAQLRRLSDGPNWRTRLVRIDEKEGAVYFTANRDSDVRPSLYKLGKDGSIKALTDTSLAVAGVSFSPDGKWFIASLSNYTTPTQVWIYETARAAEAWKARRLPSSANGPRYHSRAASSAYKAADMRGPDYDASAYALPELVYIEAEDGEKMPAAVTFPLGFDPSRKYPVHVEIYGGPNTAYVRDGWRKPVKESNQWWSDHGIIHLVADGRAAGHTGRAGTDLVYLDVVSVPVRDFVSWGQWLKSQPYVIGDKIGVEGFSFGGTMTAMLLLTHSDLFHYGVAGGGVYDWMLYDSHYTERFMDTPQNNPEGYKRARVLEYVDSYPVGAHPDGSVMLKITHGTADDNVHFQSSLQLIDALQRHGKQFELMIYPDGMHGYRGLQHQHDLSADHLFWERYLLK